MFPKVVETQESPTVMVKKQFSGLTLLIWIQWAGVRQGISVCLTRATGDPHVQASLKHHTDTTLSIIR